MIGKKLKEKQAKSLKNILEEATRDEEVKLLLKNKSLLLDYLPLFYTPDDDIRSVEEFELKKDGFWAYTFKVIDDRPYPSEYEEHIDNFPFGWTRIQEQKMTIDDCLNKFNHIKPKKFERIIEDAKNTRKLELKYGMHPQCFLGDRIGYYVKYLIEKTFLKKVSNFMNKEIFPG